MVKSMFAAVSGLRAHQAKLDVIGNNIANVNTFGYKTARATFRDVFYATTTGAGLEGKKYGGTNPNQLGYGSQVGSVDSLMTQGGTAATDNPGDCMIIGNGFFVVGTNRGVDPATGVMTGINMEVAQGSEGLPSAEGNLPGQKVISALRFTRVGIFNFDGAGNLVDSNGMLVYGYAPPVQGGGNGGAVQNGLDYSVVRPIRLPGTVENGEFKPIPLKNITFGSDGRVTGINDAEETVVVGQMAMANVPNPNALERQGNSYYSMRGNTGTVTLNPSGQNSTGRVKAGTLEMSNVDLSREFTEMITTQRGFQANTRIITVTDTMLEELVNLKR